MSAIAPSRPLSHYFCERFLLPAVCMNHTFIVSEIISRSGIDINIRSNHGQSPLSLAAERGHKDIVTLLLSHPSIDVNGQDTDGQTALGWAVFNGHVETVSELLQNSHVRTDIADVDGMTPLSWAMAKRRAVILVLLLERLGIYPNQESLKTIQEICGSGAGANVAYALEDKWPQEYYPPQQSCAVCRGGRCTSFWGKCTTGSLQYLL